MMNVLLALSVFYLYIIIMSLNPFNAENPSCKKKYFFKFDLSTPFSKITL